MIVSQWGELSHAPRRTSARESEVMASGGAGGKGTRLPVQETEEMRPRPLGREDPLEGGVATHSSILPGDPCGQGSLAAHGRRITKSRARLKRLSARGLHFVGRAEQRLV